MGRELTGHYPLRMRVFEVRVQDYDSPAGAWFEAMARATAFIKGARDEDGDNFELHDVQFEALDSSYNATVTLYYSYDGESEADVQALRAKVCELGRQVYDAAIAL